MRISYRKTYNRRFNNLDAYFMCVMKRNFLIVDDNLTVCLMLKSWLVKKGYSAETATDVCTAKKMVREQPYDMILADIRMPEIDGLTFLSWVKKHDSDILVIMMTGYADIESAISSMKSGASDYISKPIEPEQLFHKIEEAFQTQLNKQRNDTFRSVMIRPPGQAFTEIFRMLDNVVEHKSYVLITGNRGTGKAALVNYLYNKGYDLGAPLITLDMEQAGNGRDLNSLSSVPADQLSLLMDRFDEARGGILHIRAADLLDLNLQNELLGLLTRQSRDDDFVQAVLSSVKKKEELQKLLIPKLYTFLLEKGCVELPSLKGEKEIIDAFVKHFLLFSNHVLNKEVKGIEPALMEHFYSHNWEGNIQELKNMVLKAVLLTDSKYISASLSSDLFGKGEGKEEKKSQTVNSIYKLRKENYEKEKIIEALQLSKGNKTMAASILNIDRKTLYNKIKLYNVSL